VTVEAAGDREMSHQEVVELADAVAGMGGVASGIGTMRYGAQLLVEADDRDAAIERAIAEFIRAAQRAGLPPWPVTSASAISEDEDREDYE
jgi:hypothetical protein